METKFGIYDIETAYLEFMHDKDNKVPKATYESEGRQRKFYCGPVYTTKERINYFVPISSKSAASKESSLGNIKDYCIPIVNDDIEYGCLDFRFMIPCLSEYITMHQNDDTKHIFAAKQIEFCMQNKELIQATAEKTIEHRKYEISNRGLLTKTACDFDADIDYLLEYDIYCENKIEKQIATKSVKIGAIASKQTTIQTRNIKTKEKTDLGDD